MGMKLMPEIMAIENNAKLWQHTFENFKVKVYVPEPNPLSGIVNFGFKAPYLLIFEENEMSLNDAVAFADEKGFTDIAKKYSTSVVFVYPTCEGGWDNAPYELYTDLIAESRINQYFRDGVVTTRNRFTGEAGDCFIRGAIFRADLYGYGKSADFIAKNYLKTVNGLFLWGPSEITPATAILENLSVIPSPERRDLPIVSIGNSDEVNLALKASCDRLLIKDKADVIDDYNSFVWKYKQWCGVIEEEADLDALGVIEEAGYEEVTTSKDNCGDDSGTETHKIGYLAYYNKGLFDNGPVPLVMAFHGGGDSSYYITCVSGWWKVAHKYGFLLVAVENHLNSTATETVEFINKLKEKYPIDEKRIYASGFSMGGCKSWDLMQEYPDIFAALAPMSATFEVGLNTYGRPCQSMNNDKSIPVFYAGGEITPLPELPFQAQKCADRISYVFKVNKVKAKYDVKFEDRENWENKIWGINGDKVEEIFDESRGSTLTIHYFESEDGVYRTALASISGQGHECRQHTCDHAWQFMSQFSL